jgi:hypothetical protein
MPGVAVICKISTWPRRIKRLKIAKLWLRRFCRHPAWTAQAPSAEKNCRIPVQAAAKTGRRPMSATYTPIWLYLGELSALSALQ